MIGAAARAFADVMSPEFRAILGKAVGLTLLLFVALLLVVEGLIWAFQIMPWGWAEPILAVLAALGLFFAFFFLMAPVTALFAGIYLDRIADLVERRHYPRDHPGVPLAVAPAIVTGIQFGLLMLLVNIALLPTLFFGIGAIALVVANAYLLGREFFEMAAMRHMPIAEAKQLRKENSIAVFVAGFVPALLALVPIVSLIVPLFATSYFVHFYKLLRAPSSSP